MEQTTYQKYKILFDNNNNSEEIFCEIIKNNNKKYTNGNYELEIKIDFNTTIFDETDDLFFDEKINKIFKKATKKYRTEYEYDFIKDKKLNKSNEYPPDIKKHYEDIFNNIKIGKIYDKNNKKNIDLDLDIYMTLHNNNTVIFDRTRNFSLYILDIKILEFINGFSELKLNEKDYFSIFENINHSFLDENSMCEI
jgi:hypothetical protein